MKTNMKKKLMLAVAGLGLGLSVSATAGGFNSCVYACDQATIVCASAPNSQQCTDWAIQCFMCGPL
jgi:hypothetical protein